MMSISESDARGPYDEESVYSDKLAFSYDEDAPSIRGVQKAGEINGVLGAESKTKGLSGGKDDFKYGIGGSFQELQQAGILPLKIRLPKSGKIYRFNRLMTDEEALTLEATFVQLPTQWIPIAAAAAGLVFFPVGGMIFVRTRRS